MDWKGFGEWPRFAVDRTVPKSEPHPRLSSCGRLALRCSFPRARAATSGPMALARHRWLRLLGIVRGRRGQHRATPKRQCYPALQDQVPKATRPETDASRSGRQAEVSRVGWPIEAHRSRQRFQETTWNRSAIHHGSSSAMILEEGQRCLAPHLRWRLQGTEEAHGRGSLRNQDQRLRRAVGKKLRANAPKAWKEGCLLCSIERGHSSEEVKGLHP